MRKNLIIILILLTILVLSFFGYKLFFGTKESPFEFATVKRGDIAQEVLATGQVKKGEQINLSFENSGRIKKIYVEVGDNVKADQILSELETTDLLIQLDESEAVLEVAHANLDKLMAGATAEEIALAEVQVANARTALGNTKQNLADTKATAEENLKNAYDDALNILDDSYLKLYNAYDVVDLFKQTYVTFYDQEGREIRENRYKIKSAMKRAKFYLDVAKNDSTSENIDTALSEMKSALDTTFNGLTLIRETCDSLSYRNKVSAADRASLDTQKSYINTALTNLINSQQAISLTKLTNEANINVAQSQVSTAEGALETVEDELALVKAEARQEDIDLYQAQVNQAQAKVNLLENQVEEAILRSSIEGQIIKIDKKVGEFFQSMSDKTVISLIPAEPFLIKADIPEVDIGKVNLGNSCEVALDAFSEEEFSGKVIEIDPTETVIQGVVYYRVKTSLEAEEDKIKPGMTANVTITTSFKENVLVLPQRAVIEKQGKKFARVPIDNAFEEVEIKTGLRGSMGEIEILSGLKEGDKVITFIREK